MLRTRLATALVIASLLAAAAPALAGVGPTCNGDAAWETCSYPMPWYDQTNPNFAAYVTPQVFAQESVTAETHVTCVKPMHENGPIVRTEHTNPYVMSWLPYGPIPGDPNGISPDCSNWFTAICCPTAEAMALMAAINTRTPGTTYNPWITAFYRGEPPSAGLGLTQQLTSVFPWVSGRRTNMQPVDVQRVVDMALAQGTSPRQGGDVDTLYGLGSFFTGKNGPGTGTFTNVPNGITGQKLESDMLNGAVGAIAIHDYVASLANGQLSFTELKGGHCLALGGFASGSLIGPDPSPLIQVINPVYGVQEWFQLATITSGTQTNGGQTLTVMLPDGWTSVPLYPNPDFPIVKSVWDIQDGQEVTFITTYTTLTVP